MGMYVKVIKYKEDENFVYYEYQFSRPIVGKRRSEFVSGKLKSIALPPSTQCTAEHLCHSWIVTQSGRL